MKHMRRILAAAALAGALALPAAAGQMGTGFAGGETCGQIDTPPCPEADGQMGTGGQVNANGDIATPGVAGDMGLPGASGQMDMPQADGWIGTGLSLLEGVLGIF